MKKDNYSWTLFKSAIFIIIFVMLIFRVLLLYITPGEYIPRENTTLDNSSEDNYTAISQLKKSEFLKECKELCLSYNESESIEDAVKYCGHKEFLDWNNDNKTNYFLSQATGSVPFKSCDKSVYCFLVYDCGIIEWKECGSILCEYYSGDSQKVSSVLNPGNCGAEWPDEMTGGPANEICGEAVCIPSEENESSCSDGMDNDCDMFIDEEDPDCRIPECLPSEDSESSCSDGIDNDCDMMTDSEDSDCPEEEKLYSCPDKCLPVPGALCCCKNLCEDASEYDCSSMPVGSC